MTSSHCRYNFLVLLDSNAFSIENLVPLKPVLGGVRDVAHISLSLTDSTKLSLQFSYLYFGFVALDGLTFYQNFDSVDSSDK